MRATMLRSAVRVASPVILAFLCLLSASAQADTTPLPDAASTGGISPDPVPNGGTTPPPVKRVAAKRTPPSRATTPRVVVRSQIVAVVHQTAAPASKPVAPRPQRPRVRRHHAPARSIDVLRPEVAARYGIHLAAPRLAANRPAISDEALLAAALALVLVVVAGGS